MKPKQKEMDQAIESIYHIVEKQDSQRMLKDSDAKGTLIVVCGDHGMNEVMDLPIGERRNSQLINQIK